MFNQVNKQQKWHNVSSFSSHIGPFYGCAETALIAEQAPKDKLTIVLTSNQTEASTIERELPIFIKDSQEIFTLPDWETLPYDTFSPHQDIVSERLSTLYHLPELESGILIIPVSTAMHRLPPVEYVRKFSFIVKTGDHLVLESAREKLSQSGYRQVDTVTEHGEYSIRGSLFDVYPMGSLFPYRIDLFDAQVDSLREFDPATQRTVKRIPEIRILPAREFPLDSDGIDIFKLNWYKTFDNDPDNCPIFSEICAGKSPSGCEAYLPLFFHECSTIFSYIPTTSPFITVGDWKGAKESFWSEINRRHTEYGIDLQRPFLSPATCFIPPSEFFNYLSNRPLLELIEHGKNAQCINSLVEIPPIISTNEGISTAIKKLDLFKKSHEAPILICAESSGRKALLTTALKEQNIEPTEEKTWCTFIENKTNIGITQWPMDRGLYLGAKQPTLICESQLFSTQVAQRRLRKDNSLKPANTYQNLSDLVEGLPVVHLEHGIGNYTGLEMLTIDGIEEEYLTLEYDEGAKLYVPVSSLALISRYSANDTASVCLSKLGSAQWNKAKTRAIKKAYDTAANLLEIYARREVGSGFNFILDRKEYENFCASFPFEETPDQASTITSVVKDMTSTKVMDRLVCGDVGFGKTEVAMRATFLAALNKKQTAVLVPTTLLAQQHFNSFQDRFADWPVKIELVSRFRTKEDVLSISQKISSGQVDILIGTHKLLHSDFKFKDLGLLIIDEEHRFGVKQKELIKKLRAEIDILTLTATPIPRTLNIALEGIRDLSIIATPPKQRLSIKTFVKEYSTPLIQEAIAREVLRGGQVFFIHNEVKTISRVKTNLQAMNPKLAVAEAHGKMRESELEKVMSEFYHKKYDILVCTTIIETGIDIPTANTIIIDRADKLGLAQLHQLRGRVGRSHHQAYAYLLFPIDANLGIDAVKRLEAIEQAGELGSGYMLATHDLEIRGAGEILGDDQSGQIQTVGYSLYAKLLKRAVNALRQGKLPEQDLLGKESTEINLHSSSLIPDSYLPNVNTRLILYKRIVAAQNEAELKEIQLEMIDRFGLLEKSTDNLFVIAELRLKARLLGITRIDMKPDKGIIDFSSSTKVRAESLIERIKNEPEIWKLTSGNKLQVTLNLPNLSERQNFVRTLLIELLVENQLIDES